MAPAPIVIGPAAAKSMIGAVTTAPAFRAMPAGAYNARVPPAPTLPVTTMVSVPIRISRVAVSGPAMFRLPAPTREKSASAPLTPKAAMDSTTLAVPARETDPVTPVELRSVPATMVPPVS